MTALLPLLPIIMLGLSTIVLELSFTRAEALPADRSHLDDPNLHLEELVTCTRVSTRRSARA